MNTQKIALVLGSAGKTEYSAPFMTKLSLALAKQGVSPMCIMNPRLPNDIEYSSIFGETEDRFKAIALTGCDWLFPTFTFYATDSDVLLPLQFDPGELIPALFERIYRGENLKISTFGLGEKDLPRKQANNMVSYLKKAGYDFAVEITDKPDQTAIRAKANAGPARSVITE